MNVIRINPVWTWPLVVALLAMPSVVVAEMVLANLILTSPTVNTNTLEQSLSIQVGTRTEVDTETPTLHGNIMANLDIDFSSISTPTVISIETDGGRIEIDDENFFLDLGIAGTLTVTLTDVSGTANTPNGSSLVTSGNFNAAEHALVFDAGVLTTTGTNLIAIDESIDQSLEPNTVVSSSTGRVDLSLVSVTGNLATYDVTLVLPIDSETSESRNVSNFNVTQMVTVVGELRASGQITKVIPEPATAVLLLGAGAVILLSRRRRVVPI